MNVSVGAAGFVLIMVKRTGWDLTVYALSFMLDLALAIPIGSLDLGPTGAAIAQASALVVSNTLRLWLVWRFVRIQPYDRYYARLLIPDPRRRRGDDRGARGPERTELGDRPRRARRDPWGRVLRGVRLLRADA